MRNPDDQIDRLLRAAARVKDAMDPEPPIGFVTRVLAERVAFVGEVTDYSIALVCRRMVLCSVGAALLCLLLNLQTVTSLRAWYRWNQPEARLINSAVQIQIP